MPVSAWAKESTLYWPVRASTPRSWRARSGINLAPRRARPGRGQAEGEHAMPMTAAELAAKLEGELVGDPKANLRGVASLESAKPGDVVYVESEKHLPRPTSTAVIHP